jgi:hypothetical protein
MAYVDRIRKKRLGKQLDRIIETGYFVNCNNHPVKLAGWCWAGKHVFDSDVDGTSLTTGGGCSCSLFYCSPVSITETVALEMVEVYKQQGDRGLAVKYGGYTDDAYTEFETMWR